MITLLKAHCPFTSKWNKWNINIDLSSSGVYIISITDTFFFNMQSP